MTTTTSFGLEQELLFRLSEDEHLTWLAFSVTLRSSLLLTGGFMGIDVLVKNVKEITDLKFH